MHLNYAEEIRLKHLKKLKKHHQTELPQDNRQKVAKPRNKTSTEMFDEILGQLKNMGSKGNFPREISFPAQPRLGEVHMGSWLKPREWMLWYK